MFTLLILFPIRRCGIDDSTPHAGQSVANEESTTSTAVCCEEAAYMDDHV